MLEEIDVVVPLTVKLPSMITLPVTRRVLDAVLNINLALPVKTPSLASPSLSSLNCRDPVGPLAVSAPFI